MKNANTVCPICPIFCRLLHVKSFIALLLFLFLDNNLPGLVRNSFRQKLDFARIHFHSYHPLGMDDKEQLLYKDFNSISTQ